MYLGRFFFPSLLNPFVKTSVLCVFFFEKENLLKKHSEKSFFACSSSKEKLFLISGLLVLHFIENHSIA